MVCFGTFRQPDFFQAATVLSRQRRLFRRLHGFVVVNDAQGKRIIYIPNREVRTGVIISEMTQRTVDKQICLSEKVMDLSSTAGDWTATATPHYTRK